MGDRDFLELFERFLNKEEISSKELNSLRKKLNSILRKGNDELVNNIEELKLEKRNEMEDLVSEFMSYLLSKRGRLLSVLKTVQLNNREIYFKAYIKKTARNFLTDLLRSKNRGIKEEKIGDKVSKLRNNGNLKISEDELISMFSKEITENYIKIHENFYINQIINKYFKEEELKYLCYFLVSKDYKCLWGNKKESAIHKDVSRKRGYIEDKLKKLVEEHGISREAFEYYIKTELSVICEKLRNKNKE